MLSTSQCAGLCSLALILFAAPGVASAHQYTESVAWAFAGTPDGDGPTSLVADKQGNIYGTTAAGGSGACTAGCGTIFKIATDGTKTILYSFNGAPFDASSPAGLAIDRHGNLYGAGYFGGAAGFGGIFKLTPDGHETLLHSFYTRDKAFKQGFRPTALAMGADGFLYGATQYGGTALSVCNVGCGTVFRISPKGRVKTLYRFQGQGKGDGMQPYGGITLGPDGTIYGTTLYGGGTLGTVYKVDHVSGAETMLHAFTGSKQDGAHPQTPPIADDAGNLYGGTTESSGRDCDSHGCGMLYKIAPDGTYTILYDFDSGAVGFGGDAFSVSSALYRDTAGNLYGTTRWGGASSTCSPSIGCGAVFQFTPGGALNILYKFQGPANGDAQTPYGMLLRDRAGGDAFYGMTLAGPNTTCADGCGSIFKLAIGK